MLDVSKLDAHRRTVMVTGSRSWTDYSFILMQIRALRPRPQLLIEGGALGADRLARTAALKCGIEVRTVSARWSRYGRMAGPLRNQEMVDLHPDLVLAFWDGVSRGTEDAIRRARKAGIETKVFQK